MGTLERRATFELDCPREQIVISEIDDRTVFVEGCQQRATYVEVCERHGQYNEHGECKWILDHKH